MEASLPRKYRMPYRIPVWGIDNGHSLWYNVTDNGNDPDTGHKRGYH
jgi:hypothetical protein